MSDVIVLSSKKLNIEVMRPTSIHKVGTINGVQRRKFKNGKRSKNVEARTRFKVIEKPPIFINENMLSANPIGIIEEAAVARWLTCIFQPTMMQATFGD